MVLRDVVADRVQSNRASLRLSALKPEDLNRIVSQIVCQPHQPEALFPYGTGRQYWKCSKCGEITT